LCAEAKSGQILINQPSLDGLENLFVVEPVGDLNLKGFQRPVPVANIVSIKDTTQGHHASDELEKARTPRRSA
jgi:class 3 adenylate cyclase